MQSFKKYSLLFFSITLFSFLFFPSLGKSGVIVPACSIQKHAAESYSPLTHVSNWNPVNPYVRNNRGVKVDNILLADAVQQDAIHYAKPVKFIVPSIEQGLIGFCAAALIPRAPPLLS